MLNRCVCPKENARMRHLPTNLIAVPGQTGMNAQAENLWVNSPSVTR